MSSKFFNKIFSAVYWFFRRKVPTTYKRITHVTRELIHIMPFFMKLEYFRIKQGKNPRFQIIGISLIEQMGDIVACEPAIRHLRKTYPEALIVWPVRKPFKELVDENPDVDISVTVKCFSGVVLLAWLGAFDKMFHFHFAHHVCGGCDMKLARTEGNTEIASHRLGSLLESHCESAGVPLRDGQPEIHIPEAAEKKIDACGLPEKYVSFHCSASGTEKDWPVERWAALAKKINKELGLAIIEIGVQCKLAPHSNDGVMNLCSRLSILESAEVIRRSSLFVGIDSGPAHLANATGTKGVILMSRKFRELEGFMPFSGWYKDGSKAIILRGEEVGDIPVEDVFGAIVSLLRRE